MARGLGRIGSIGRIAAWAAAYALVFQVVLTSALIAGLPLERANALYELCRNSDSAAAPLDERGGGPPSVIHCPLCLLRSDITALPPPEATPITERRVAVFRFDPVFQAFSVDVRLPSQHQPRAPPRLS